MSDKLVKLIFPEKNCRAAVLHMDEAWQTMTKNQHLPEPVKLLLGQMCAGAVLLAGSLKFDGALVLQLQGDSPVRLALVEVRTGLVVRATAQLRAKPEDVPETAAFKDLVNATGHGRCAMILDASDRRAGEEPYQGVVALEDDGVAATLESYMTHSEQLTTRLWLAADDSAIGGVMLQRMPKSGGLVASASEEPEDESFETLVILAQTVKDEELTKLEADTVAKRLFWEDNPRVLATLTPVFRCRCSKHGIEAMVRNLGQSEAEKIIAERGTIDVTCEFCGAHYMLDAVDVGALFHNGTTEGASMAKN